MKAPSKPRAPAVAEKMEAARVVLAEFSAEVAQTVLDVAENVAGAPKRLYDLRTKISTAEREFAELEKAHVLAMKLDRQANAASAAAMRADQLAAFKASFAEREEAMGAVLAAAAAMAKAYGEYSEATLRAATVIPTGTTVPQMAMGPLGRYGPAFGPCELLILAELFRLAPERSDGIGRFVLPFARTPAENARNQPGAIPAGADELAAADRAILANIEAQITRLNNRDSVAAQGVAA